MVCESTKRNDPSSLGCVKHKAKTGLTFGFDSFVGGTSYPSKIRELSISLCELRVSVLV